MGPDEYVVAWPTLGFLAADWIEAHCTVPSGHDLGDPLVHDGWQLWCTVNHYRVKPGLGFNPVKPLLAPAFHYRRSVVVGPQKNGKSPWGASVVIFEAVGPCIFAGYAKGGEVYLCSDHGCGCGFEFVYEPGDAMGMPRSKSLIQLLATAETQTANVYEPIQTMIRSGPLDDVMKVREGFIRLPNNGKIEPVSAAARSKLGNPINAALGDESGLYTASNKLLTVWQTMRRGLAGMGGRALEITNPWDPSENSAAQQAFESKRRDIFRHYNKPPADLSYRNKAERHKIHLHVYADAPWVDVRAIDAEAAELVETDLAQAERFFGNRTTAGLGTWVPVEAWDARAKPRTIDRRTPVVLGFDGSDVDDWTGLRAETQDGYQFTPVTPTGPTIWNPADYGGKVPRLEVAAALAWCFEFFQVTRLYADPPYWETELDQWAEQFGEKRVVRWPTYRPLPMHAALERMVTDVAKSDSGFTHDGCSTTSAHVGNARRAARLMGSVPRYVLTKPGDGRKIDLAVCSVLAHEAAGDVTAAKLWPRKYRAYSA